VVFVQSGHWLITSRNASAKQGTRLRWILHRYHLVFLSSVSFSTTTGAAGMLNHHSLNLLVHRSVLALRGGELLVHTSRNISSISTLVGTMARLRAISTNATIALSVALRASLSMKAVLLDVFSFLQLKDIPSVENSTYCRLWRREFLVSLSLACHKEAKILSLIFNHKL